MAHRTVALPLALLLSLLLAAQVVAAGWSEPIMLASGQDAAYSTHPGLVAIGASTAVMAYSNSGGTFVRRSTDAGATWGNAIELSASGFRPVIAGRGQHVDVAWLDGQWVRYARSTDGGATFSPSVGLSSGVLCEDECSLHSVSVARGPNGLVAVAWGELWMDGESYVRVSGDGGATFRKPKFLGYGRLGAQVAVGRGVVYVAYQAEWDHGCCWPLLIRRSLDRGASWSAPRVIAQKPFGSGHSIAAAGSDAYIAWTLGDGGGIRYRRTADRGTLWSSRLNLTSPRGNKRFPVLSMRRGVVQATFTQRSTPSWESSGVFYRRSVDGMNWSRTRTVSVTGTPLGVGCAGQPLVLYLDDEELYVRARTP